MNNEQSAQHTVEWDGTCTDSMKRCPTQCNYCKNWDAESAASSQIAAKWKCVNCGAECESWDEECKNCTPKEVSAEVKEEELQNIPFKIIAENQWEGTKHITVREKWVKLKDVQQLFSTPKEEKDEWISVPLDYPISGYVLAKLGFHYDYHAYTKGNITIAGGEEYGWSVFKNGNVSEGVEKTISTIKDLQELLAQNKTVNDNTIK